MHRIGQGPKTFNGNSNSILNFAFSVQKQRMQQMDIDNTYNVRCIIIFGLLLLQLSGDNDADTHASGRTVAQCTFEGGRPLFLCIPLRQNLNRINIG